ncbi:MAG: hypothetical protein QOD69_1936 [Solirubrobacteraceae bacterium]|jgi:uncharacterized protein YndB with AHSA1/START domain|nr:hypothetical protein [Solirubrobacteraceae bacterium]
MNGRLDTVDDRPALRFERRLSHPVERVWRAITEPEDLRHWFPGVPRFTLEKGAEFVVEGDTGGTGRILALDPPHVLDFTWNGDRLRFELAPDGDGCVLTFLHAFDDRDHAARDAAGWELCFDRLEAQLAGSPLDEHAALERWPALHERYAEAFGVDPEVGRRAYAEHPTQQSRGS